MKNVLLKLIGFSSGLALLGVFLEVYRQHPSPVMLLTIVGFEGLVFAPMTGIYMESILKDLENLKEKNGDSRE